MMTTPEDGGTGDDLLDALLARLPPHYGEGIVGGAPLDTEGLLMCIVFLADPEDLGAAAAVVGIERLREVLEEMVGRGMLWPESASKVARALNGIGRHT